MACHVGEGLGGLEEVTFLYKLTLGACPRSYGVNVARLAGELIIHSIVIVCLERGSQGIWVSLRLN